MGTISKKKYVIMLVVSIICALFLGTHFVTAEEEKKQEDSAKKDVEVRISQEVEKYLLTQENQVLLQEKIGIQNNDDLQKEKEIVRISVPILEDKVPDIAIVLYNAQKLDEQLYNYDKESKTIEIKNTDMGDEKEYKIIYGYIDIGLQEKVLVSTKVETEMKFVDDDTIYKNENQYEEEIAPCGDKVSMNGKITASLDKGYLYATSSKEINFGEQYLLEISNLQDIQEINLNTAEVSFAIDEQYAENADDHIVYKQTRIHKENMLNILGENGEIQIRNTNNDVLYTLNKDSQTDEEGYIIIKYPENTLTTNIQFHTSIPKEIGTLKIENIKAISPNIDDAKTNIEKYKALREKLIINGKETILTSELKEPKTTITMDMNKQQLDTMNEKNELELNLTLNSQNASERLFKNPYIEITFPQQVQEITLREPAQLLYNNQLQIAQCVVENNSIKIYITGEQTQYTEGFIKGGEINLKLSIKLDNKASDAQEKINVKCINDGEEVQVENDIKIVSPKDMITVNRIEELNIETVGKTDTQTVEVTPENKEKTMQVTSKIINNNKTVSNVHILGDFPTDSNQVKQNGETVENNMGITVNTPVVTNRQNVTIYYTEKADANSNLEDENNGWSTNATQNASKYLIVLDSMEPKEELDVQYGIQMAKDLEYNEKASQGYSVEYTDTENNSQYSLKSTYLYMTTGAGPVVETSLYATVGNKELKENDVVKKGEVIRYLTEVKNTGTEDVSDIKLSANVPEGTVFVTPEEDYIFETGKFYTEKEDIKTVESTILNLKVGESVKKYYEVRVKSDAVVDSTITNLSTIEYNGVKKQSPALNNKVGDATLRISMKCVIGEDITISEGDTIQYQAIIENISNETQNNVTLRWNASDVYTFKSQSFSGSDESIESNTMTIDQIEANGKIVVDARFLADQMVESTQEVEVYAELIQGDNTYISNNWKEQINSKYNVDVEMESTNEGATLKPGDEITYTIKMVNNNLATTSISLYDELPIELSVTEVTVNGEPQESGEEANNVEISSIELEPQEQVTVVVKTSVDYVNSDDTVDIANIARVYVNGKEKTSNEIKNTIQYKAENVKNIDIIVSSNNEGKMLEPGNEVNYQIKLVNHNLVEISADLYDEIPAELSIQGIYIDGEEQQRENSRNTIELSGIVLQPEEEKIVEIKTIVDNNGDISETKEISNIAKVSFNGEQKSSNEIKNTIQYKAEDVENIDITIESANQGQILEPGNTITYTIKLVNHNYVSSNVTVQDLIPEELTINKIIVNGEEQTFEAGINAISIENLELQRQVENIVEIQTTINEVEDLNEIKEISNSATVILMDKEKTSNIVRHNVNYETEEGKMIDIVMKADKENEEVKPGEEIKYTIVLTNKDTNPLTVSVKDEVPAELTVQSVYVNGMMQNPGEEANIVSVESVEVPAQGESTIEIHTMVNEKGKDDTRETVEIANRASVYVNEIEGKSNVVRHTISYKTQDGDGDGDGDGEDGDGEDGDGEDGDNNQGGDNEKRYTISGMVWVDQDKNGEMQGAEERLSGIPVYLIDVSTGTIAKDHDGDEIKATTNDSGYYALENVEQGSYMVAFEYDTSQYQLTAYMQNAVDESKTSKVVTRRMNLTGEEKVYGVTDTITVTNVNIGNIHMGLTVSEVFDMQLEKYISRIVVSNTSTRTQYDYNQTSIAKIELKAKNINSTNITVEYQIKVSNIGEMAGYAREVIDYLPEGFSFNETVNKDWTLRDGKLINTSLTNEELQPGETRTLTLVLTKNMSDDQTGTYVNEAELGEVYNVNGIDDINSTPGNRQDGENDMGKAELIISISTGAAMMYIGLSITIIVTIFIGVYIIKKKVL